jgi:CBS domain-containing protein
VKVEDVMTTKVITVTEHSTKQQAARLLAQHRISGPTVARFLQEVKRLLQTPYSLLG